MAIAPGQVLLSADHQNGGLSTCKAINSLGLFAAYGGGRARFRIPLGQEMMLRLTEVIVGPDVT